jgi:hypothetical protein
VILPVVPRMLTVGDIRGHEKVPVCGQVKSLSLACRRVFWARAVTVAARSSHLTEAQNNGIYAAEPRDPDSAASFRQWGQDTLKPAVQA